MEGRQVGQSGACSFAWRTKMSARAHTLVADADGTTEVMSSSNRHRLVLRILATQECIGGVHEAVVCCSAGSPGRRDFFALLDGLASQRAEHSRKGNFML
jgi:hypothetical protein